MVKPKPLSNEEIKDSLLDLLGWQHQENKLKRSYECKDFQAAISFIIRVAFPAEKYDHHPEIYNVYNKVEIALTTHDAGNCVTVKDIMLANAIDQIAKEQGLVE